MSSQILNRRGTLQQTLYKAGAPKEYRFFVSSVLSFRPLPRNGTIQDFSDVFHLNR
jgi:hypothetical protein